jgi:arginine deiminase
MYAAGKRAGINSVAAAFEQLMDQLAAARAEHNAMMERLQAEFESEVAALRKELAEAYAMMERYRTINEFIRYERSEHDTVN